MPSSVANHTVDGCKHFQTDAFGFCLKYTTSYPRDFIVHVLCEPPVIAYSLTSIIIECDERIVITADECIAIRISDRLILLGKSRRRLFGNSHGRSSHERIYKYWHFVFTKILLQCRYTRCIYTPRGIGL